MNGWLDWGEIERSNDWGLREKSDAMGARWDAGADMWDARWKADLAFTKRQADALVMPRQNPLGISRFSQVSASRLTMQELSRAYHWAESIRNETATTCHHNSYSPSCGLSGLQVWRIRESGG